VLLTVPLAVFALVIAGVASGAGLMVSVKLVVPVPLPLVALNVAAAVVEVVGVPEINPVPVFTESPAGKPVAA
jgi:hypothetical protein